MMAFTVAAIFYALSRSFPCPRDFRGVVAVECFMEPPFSRSITSLWRRFYRGFAVSICNTRSYSSLQWAGSQLVIPPVLRGLPIALVMRQYSALRDGSR